MPADVSCILSVLLAASSGSMYGRSVLSLLLVYRYLLTTHFRRKNISQLHSYLGRRSVCLCVCFVCVLCKCRDLPATLHSAKLSDLLKAWSLALVLGTPTMFMHTQMKSMWEKRFKMAPGSEKTAHVNVSQNGS